MNSSTIYFLDYKKERGETMAEQVNIYDTANQLAKEVTETKEFKDLKEALDQAKADEASNKIYTEFQETQLTIQQQQAAGQEVEQEKIKRLQELSEEMQDDDLLKEGGHIGDGIRPSERRKGYATKMIALALEECKKLGKICLKELYAQNHRDQEYVQVPED